VRSYLSTIQKIRREDALDYHAKGVPANPKSFPVRNTAPSATARWPIRRGSSRIDQPNPVDILYIGIKNALMETPTKPLRGMAIIRRLVEVKKKAQLDAVENYRNNPEIRSVVDKLKEVNGKRKAA
jgi:hypothetical protein